MKNIEKLLNIACEVGFRRRRHESWCIVVNHRGHEKTFHFGAGRLPRRPETSDAYEHVAENAIAWVEWLNQEPEGT